jgi:2-keto-4-pentenoate hydratase/2-oxohepta-3-ene-1,7-dioic acid hydratase in catechol pathway
VPRIFCVGRNYAEHAAELGNQVEEQPVIFMKPDSALIKGEEMKLQRFMQDLHFEGELVFRVAEDIPIGAKKFPVLWWSAVTVGIDFTERAIQSSLKQRGLPWELSKAFDGSAALGKWLPRPTVPAMDSWEFSLMVNRKVRQQGSPIQMVHDPESLAKFINGFFALRKGDMIFTGTPAGVGPVKAGDVLEGHFLLRKVLYLMVSR